MSTIPLPPSAREYAHPKRAAAEHGVSERTIRNYAAKGYFTLYRVEGRRGIQVDLHEVRRALRSLPSRQAIAGVGAYGPKARVVVVRRDEQ